MSTFLLNGVHVDVPGNRLVRDDGEVHLEPKVMRVLCVLGDRPGEVVPRSTLLDIVWAGQVVEDDALTTSVVKLRRALGDDPREPRFIATVPKVGYRLVADLGQAAAPEEASPAADGRDPVPVAAPAAGKPSVAVLGFEPSGEGSEQRLLADGLTQDVAGALSCLRWLSAISLLGASPASDGDRRRPVAEALGVDFLIRGTVRRAGERLRISVFLERCRNHEVLWSERYDRELTDLFEVEDEICTRVTARLEAELSVADQGRLRSAAPASLTAWECYQRGLLARQGRVGAPLGDAQAEFRRAMTLDPGFAAPRAALALALVHEIAWVLIPESERDDRLDEAMAHANAAIRIEPREYLGYVARSRCFTYMGENGAALSDAEAAMERNPNSATALMVRAACRMANSGRSEATRALADLQRAVQLSPLDPYIESLRYGVAAVALLRLDRYDEAIRWGEAGMQVLHSPSWSVVTAAAAYYELGETGHAADLMDDLKRRRPGLTVAALLGRRRFGDDAFHTWLITRLQACGLPR